MGPAVVDKWTAGAQEWMQAQGPGMQVGLITLGGATQGAFLGGVFGAFSQMQASLPPPPNATATQLASMKAMQQGGPWGQARNFAVMSGLNAGLNAAFKKFANREDVWTTMTSSLAAGTCYALVAKLPGGVPGAVSAGAFFALFSGGAYKFSEATGGRKKDGEDDLYYTRAMLEGMGLGKYAKNLGKEQVTDDCLPLLTEQALKDCKIPVGPRLQILDVAPAYYEAHVAEALAEQRAAKAAAANDAIGPLSLSVPLPGGPGDKYGSTPW